MKMLVCLSTKIVDVWYDCFSIGDVQTNKKVLSHVAEIFFPKTQKQIKENVFVKAIFNNVDDKHYS